MMIRSNRSLTFLLAALACAASAQDTQQKVTFASRAATAKQVLESLTKATGVNFATSPQTAGEILLVDVKQVPLADLMAKIAQAAAAEWKQEGEAFRLIRSQALQSQQERAFLEDRAKRIRVEQQKLVNELASQKALTPAEIQKLLADQQKQAEEFAASAREGRPVPNIGGTTAAFNMTPANRLLMRLLTSINATDLAAIRAGTRSVLASTPTRMQRALPPTSGQALSAFVKEYQQWLAAQPQKSSDAGGERSIFDLSGSFTPMNGGLGKVLLILTRNPFNPNLQAELIVADQTGAVVARQFRSIQTSSVPGASPQATEGASVPAGEKGIALSQESKEHSAFLNQTPQRGNVMIAASPTTGRAGGATVVRSAVEINVTAQGGGGGGRTPRLPVSQEWADRLVHPERHDPLSFAISDLYVGLAQARGENLVASLPDSVLIPLGGRAQQTVTPNQLIEMSKNDFDLLVDSSGGWLTVMPKFPSNVRELRVDRTELGRLLGGIKADGRLSLDNLSRYAASRNDPVPNPGLDARYINTLFPLAFNEFMQATSNWRMHQIFNTLSVEQRRTLAADGTISLGTLSPRQQNLVSSLVYDDLAGPFRLETQPGGVPGAAPVQRSEMVFAGQGGNMLRFGSSGGSLSDERTEYLPNGVPPNGVLSADVSSQDGVFASNKEGTADPRFFNAESYGAYVGIAPNIVLTGGASGPPPIPQYDRFRLAQIQTMDFTFQLSADAQMVRTLRDAWFVQGSTETTYDLLPQGFRQKVEEQAARMKGSSARIGIGGDGRPRPPQ